MNENRNSEFSLYLNGECFLEKLSLTDKQLFLLNKIFVISLPHKENDGSIFYNILGIKKNADNYIRKEQIKKVK
jgi:hypothetical protein